MILEANRIVSSWLNDPTYGVNALLATTLLDAGDTVPVPIALITDETQNGTVARDELPTQRPCICVSVDMVKDLDGQVQTVTADGHLKLRIRVAVDDALTADGKRDLSYYLRTVIRSFRLLMAAPDGPRTRNHIYLGTCDFFDQAIVWAKDQQGTTTVTGYVLPTITLRDTQP